MDLPPDFRDRLEAFARASVDVVLVGAYAVAYHARPRATKDIDLVLRGDPENLERAADALADFGAPRAVVEAVRSLGEGEVAYMGQPPLGIDLHGRSMAWTRRRSSPTRSRRRSTACRFA
jgi:hypothetical protein